PVIHLQPGQKLTLQSGALYTKALPNPFAAKAMLYRYPAHTFEITGGVKQEKALQSLKEQYKEQESSKPVEEQEVPDPKNALIGFPPPPTPAPPTPVPPAPARKPGQDTRRV